MKRVFSALLVLCLLCMSAMLGNSAKAATPTYKLIIWLNEDGSILDQRSYNYPDPEPKTDKVPVKAPSYTCYYVFAKWDDGVVYRDTKVYSPIFTAVKYPVRPVYTPCVTYPVWPVYTPCVTYPVQPVQPCRPVTPVQPVQPCRPVTPVQPVQPCRPAKPCQPVRPVHVTEITVDGAVYKLDDQTGTAKLTELTSKRDRKSLTVPATVSANGRQYKVTMICHDVCANMQSLKEVTIGKYVETIAKRAFWQCPKLKAINFQGKKLTEIDDKAFEGINEKAKATVPNGVYSYYKEMLLDAGFPETGTIQK